MNIWKKPHLICCSFPKREEHDERRWGGRDEVLSRRWGAAPLPRWGSWGPLLWWILLPPLGQAAWLRSRCHKGQVCKWNFHLKKQRRKCANSLFFYPSSQSTPSSQKTFARASVLSNTANVGASNFTFPHIITVRLFWPFLHSTFRLATPALRDYAPTAGHFLWILSGEIAVSLIQFNHN